MSVQQKLQENRGVEVKRDTTFRLPPYPVDMSSFLLPSNVYDTLDTQFQVQGSTIIHDPTTLVQYALAHWNQYLISRNEYNRNTFLLQAHRLVAHAVPIREDASGWPVFLVQPTLPTQ